MIKIFLFLSITSALLYCKNTPVLSIANPIDPESEKYIVSPPSGFGLSFTDNEAILSWKPSNSDIFDGYLIYYSVNDTTELEIIAELDNNVVSFKHVPTGNPINLLYRIKAYYDQKNRRVFSESVQIELTQEIFEISAFEFEDLKVEINIDHSFASFSEFRIEQRIGKHSPFELIQVSSTNASPVIVQYNSLPQEEVTYRVFVENDYERTDYYETLVYGYFEAPRELKILRNEETEIEIGWENYTHQIDEVFLVPINYNDTLTTGAVISQSNANDSITLSDLNPHQIYAYELRVRRGGFYSSFNTGFELKKGYPTNFEQSIPFVLNGLEQINGDISSDGNYTSFDVSGDRQFVYETNTLEELYRYTPTNRFVNTTIVENDDKIYYTEFKEFNNSGNVELKSIPDNTLYKTIPASKVNEYIQAVSFIKNTPLVLVYSSEVTTSKETHTVFLYNFVEETYVKTLISLEGRNNFKLSSSDKSILVYDVYNLRLIRFSKSNFELLNEIPLSSITESEINSLVNETVPQPIRSSTDFYNFFVFPSEVFRMNLENPVKEKLPLSLGNRNTIYQFGFSQNGQLKCTNTIDAIRCYSYFFNEAFELNTNSPIAGFLLSPNDEYIIVFTEFEMQKFSLENKWEIINYESEPF